MSSYRVYQLYNALKLHFTEPKFTYSGTIPSRFSEENFENRKDRMKFEKISNRFSKIEDFDGRLIKFFSSVFLYHPTLWIGDISDNVEKYETYIRERIKYSSNVFEAFRRDLDPIFMAFEASGQKPTLDHLFRTNVVNDGIRYEKIPEIVNMIPTKKLNPETVVILDFFFKFLEPEEGSPLIWKNICHRLRKFRTFMNVTEKDIKLIRNYLRENLKQ